jgi:hypothetical protein
MSTPGDIRPGHHLQEAPVKVRPRTTGTAGSHGPARAGWTTVLAQIVDRPPLSKP